MGMRSVLLSLLFLSGNAFLSSNSFRKQPMIDPFNCRASFSKHLLYYSKWDFINKSKEKKKQPSSKRTTVPSIKRKSSLNITYTALRKKKEKKALDEEELAAIWYKEYTEKKRQKKIHIMERKRNQKKSTTLTKAKVSEKVNIPKPAPTKSVVSFSSPLPWTPRPGKQTSLSKASSNNNRLFFMSRRSFNKNEISGFEFAGGYNFEDLPSFGLPEIAFLGRSNVGKSSMLNALAGANHAVVSKTPGRTQRINVFKVSDKKAPFAVIADLPGYGYASISMSNKMEIQDFMRKYLTTRRELSLLIMLVDSRLGPQPIDVEAIAYFRSENIPLLVVATKMDKISQSDRESLSRLKVALDLGVEEGPLPFSAITKEGRDKAWDIISDVVTVALKNRRNETKV